MDMYNYQDGKIPVRLPLNTTYQVLPRKLSPACAQAAMIASGMGAAAAGVPRVQPFRG